MTVELRGKLWRNKGGRPMADGRDWPKAIERSAATIILPIGVLEKHGPQAPIGSDLIHVRERSARATKREYAVVFPDYFL